MPAASAPPEGDAHDAIRAALARSAEFWPDLLDATGLEAEEALPALWELVWAGEVTNDAWTPLRAARRYGVPQPERRPRRFSRTRGSERRRRPRVAGHRRAGSSARTPDRRALAELLLERQGIVTRDGVRGEGIAGGYGAVYGELRTLETIGACRRGYFVDGLGGAQFALPGAVERLRELRDARGRSTRSCWPPPTRPSPTGRRCRGRSRAGARAARVAGAHVVLLGGEAALYVERGGRTLVPLREPEEAGCATRSRPSSVGASRSREAACRRALRRPARRRDRGDAPARRGRLPRRPASRRAQAVDHRSPATRTLPRRLTSGSAVRAHGAAQAIR